MLKVIDEVAMVLNFGPDWLIERRFSDDRPAESIDTTVDQRCNPKFLNNSRFSINIYFLLLKDSFGVVKQHSDLLTV